MNELIVTELYKIIKRPRTYIGFAAITLIVTIIHLALYVDGANYVRFITMQIEQHFSIEGKIINGNLDAYIIMQTFDCANAFACRFSNR
jgi:ABC-2 type transport system permease protein